MKTRHKVKDTKVVNDATFFKKPKKAVCNQQVNVTVTVNEKQDDCLTGCFKGLFRCGAKAASEG